MFYNTNVWERSFKRRCRGLWSSRTSTPSPLPPSTARVSRLRRSFVFADHLCSPDNPSDVVLRQPFCTFVPSRPSTLLFPARRPLYSPDNPFTFAIVYGLAPSSFRITFVSGSRQLRSSLKSV